MAKEATVKQKLKTPIGKLKYCFIKGEGRNQEIDPKLPANMCYTASVVVPKDSKEHKAFEAELTKVWNEYKKVQASAKGTLKTSCIKEETIKDPVGTIDPETDEVKRLPTGNIIITAYTKTTWADGKPKLVKKLSGKGDDITKSFDAVDWNIGEGSTGVVHGVAVGNTGGGKAKITFYLSAVQIAKLVKYEGDAIDAEDIGGDDIDLTDAITVEMVDTGAGSEPTSEETPRV